MFMKDTELQHSSTFPRRIMGVPWIIACAVLVMLAYAALYGYRNVHTSPPPHNAQALKELNEKIAADQRADEVQHEANFKKDHADMPIIARIVTPDGKTVTGRIEFMAADCPAGSWCAQPDGRVTDHDLNEPLAEEARAMEENADLDARNAMQSNEPR